MTTTSLQIDMWPLDRARPFENHLFELDQPVYAVAASIKEYGISQLLVVHGDSVIIGWERLPAAQRLGVDRVSVVHAWYLTLANI